MPADSQHRTRISRRNFLRYVTAGLGVAAVGGAIGLSGCAPSRLGEAAAVSSGATSEPVTPDVELALRAAPNRVQILPGPETQVWQYRGEVLKGRAEAVQPLPGSYLGPILRLEQGEWVRIHLTNELSEPTIVHWHGLHVPESADGHPRLAIEPGETYTYEFQVLSRPGTYWYHPHPHGRTGPQVLYGLAGLLIVTGDEERGHGLPEGDYDIPLVIQDRAFDDENQLRYLEDGMGTQMMGFLGDRVLVNSQPDFILPVATRPYRLRLLNGSNSRIYRLGWQDGSPLTVIATDGGLLERAVERPYVTLAPGERVELWVDFGTHGVGTEVALEDRSPNHSNGTPIARFQVDRQESTDAQLPDRLSAIAWEDPNEAINRRRPRTFELDMARMQWLINGRTFEMEGVARDEVVRLGDLEVWEFVNESPRMAMPHPMHIHNVRFQVLERQILPQFADQYRTVAEGYVDEGWKDTVLVMPGERVKVLLRFENFEGLYVYHCHNLEHEDMGMMRNFRVKA